MRIQIEANHFAVVVNVIAFLSDSVQSGEERPIGKLDEKKSLGLPTMQDSNQNSHGKSGTVN